MEIKISLLNCFLLIVPVFLWNGLLYKKLPNILSDDQQIPKWILKLEDSSRFLVFFLPIFIPLNLNKLKMSGKIGLTLYFCGLFIYFASWVPHLMYQNKKYADLLLKSKIIFLGPFITPFLFLSGLAIIGESLLYFSTVCLLIVVHGFHGLLTHRQYIQTIR